MGYTLIWTDEQIEAASEDFSYHVANNLEDGLDSKEDEIKWKNSMAELSQRFQEIISFDGVDITVAELRFSAQSSEYRALCIVLPDEEVLFYYTTVPKKGSHQQRQLDIIRDNSEEILESIRKSID